jgi:hypothetical protein
MKQIGTSLAWMTVLLLSIAAQAQPLVDRIPQDAVIYIGWSGSESMGPAYEGSHLKAVVEASNIKQLFDESIPRLLENLGHQDEDAAMVMSIISTVGGPMWRHPSAIYFGGADVNNPDFPMPKLAFICDAGKEGKDLVTHIDKLITSHGQPPIPYKAEEHDGLVVIAFGNVEVSATKKPAVPLSTRKEFKAAMAQVGKDPVVAVYIDVEGGIDQIDQVVANFAPPQAKQKWGTIRDAIGLRSLKRIAWTGGFDGKEWSNQALIEAPEPRAGLIKALIDAKPISDATLKAIPITATMAAAGHFDAGGLLGAIREMVKKIDADASGEFEQGLDEVKQAIGMDLQADILDTLGDEWALYSDPNVGGNGMLGLTVVNHLKDPAKAEKAFTQLEQLLNGMLKEHLAGAPMNITFNTTHQGDLTIHYLGIPVIAPSWAIKDGNLYVGLYPQVVSGAADHVASKGKSILENEDFMALRKRLGESTEISAISYSDLPRTAAEGYQEVLMLSRVYLGLADLFGAKTPALALPTLNKLLPHVTPAASVAWVDKTGWHSKQITPFPGSEILNGGGMGSIMAAQQAMFLGAALPSLNRSRMTANRVKDATNLRQIGQAMMIYANGNKGKFPATPGELFLTQDLNIDIFINPEMHTAAPVGNDKEELAQWINQSGGYTYLAAGKTDPAGPEVVLAHDKIRPGAQGISLLFGDGHVEWMPLASAQGLINKQMQADAAKAPKAGQ